MCLICSWLWMFWRCNH